MTRRHSGAVQGSLRPLEVGARCKTVFCSLNWRPGGKNAGYSFDPQLWPPDRREGMHCTLALNTDPLKETFLLNPNDTFRFSYPNLCSMYNVYNFSGSRDQTRQRIFTGLNPNLVAVRKYPPPPGNVHLLHVTHCPQPHFWNF